MKHYALLPLLFCGLVAAIDPVVAADATLVSLQQAISAAPGSAAAAITQTLKAAGSNAALLAGPATAAAIQSLGANATSKQIAAIVFAAVRVVPDSALRIVRAAVSVAPNAAPEIAAAAARAVPNPWKEVRYQRGTPAEPPPQNVVQPPGNREPDFKSAVDSSFLSALDAVLAPAAPGEPMSLAEAIVQTAADARGGDPGGIQGAVDAAVFGDPSQLFNAVSGSRGISGVGDAGLSNYANEPRFPGPSIVTTGNPPTPPATPNPPPVSP